MAMGMVKTMIHVGVGGERKVISIIKFTSSVVTLSTHFPARSFKLRFRLVGIH